MRTEIIAAGVMIAAAIMASRYFDDHRIVKRAAPSGGAAQESASTGPVIAAAAPSYGAIDPYKTEVRIAAERDNQFYVDASVNFSPARFLVDTGAGYVALRESDARRAGLHLSWSDFDTPVRTANGETNAAKAMLSSMQLGDIRIDGVEAFILRDDQLSVNLLGMSFLSRLDSVEARAGELVLRG